MATYKLIQDIEAEDHILGPLTLRQFIFAMVAVFLFYMCFLVVAKHVIFMLVIFLPPALFFGFFALPFGRDQPTEIWFLAKLQFWFKPRKRVWNQSGVKELVTITVPKKVERVLTKGFSQTEVQSRLQALAQTLDTRGWAVKHVGTDAFIQPVDGDSDRLIDISSLPQEVPADATPVDDIMDETSSPIARQFEDMIEQSEQTRRQQLVDQLNGAQKASPQSPDNWFTGQSHPAAPGPAPVPTVSGGSTADAAPDDKALGASLAARASSRQVSFGNLRTMQPLGTRAANTGSVSGTGVPGSPADGAGGQSTTMTTPSDPAILSLAGNDDLDVATLARQARKNRGDDGQSPSEVVIPLH